MKNQDPVMQGFMRKFRPAFGQTNVFSVRSEKWVSVGTKELKQVGYRVVEGEAKWNDQLKLPMPSGTQYVAMTNIKYRGIDDPPGGIPISGVYFLRRK